MTAGSQSGGHGAHAAAPDAVQGGWREPYEAVFPGHAYGTVPTTLPDGRPLFRDEEPWPGI
ncbi:hypothetical protein ACWD4J_27365 [Streptomyces sp. NPDC002577]